MITIEQREAEVSTLSKELIEEYRCSVAGVAYGDFAGNDYTRKEAEEELTKAYGFLLARIAYLEKQAKNNG